MLKGIIFDMDGVLINSEPFHFRVWKETLAVRDINLDYEIYKPCIGSTINFLMNILHDNYGVDVEDRQLIQDMKEHKQRLVEKEGFPLIEGVREMLSRLKEAGLRLCIASSSPIAYIRQVTETLEIGGYFDILVSGEQVANPKPSPDVFLEAAKRMGLMPRECLIVEDSGNGCKAAKAAEIACIAYYNPDSGRQDLSTAAVVVEGYEEIDGAFMYKTHCHYHHLPAKVCDTPRLVIREIGEADIPRMMEICLQESSADAVEGAGNTLEEEVEGFPAYRKYMYEMCDMGYWAIVKKSTGEIIGRAGVEPKIWNHNSSVLEFGYIMDEEYRGQGYGYEACQGILQELYRRGAMYLHCRIKKSNEASISFARKLGFEKIDYHLEDDEQDVEVYRYSCRQ